MTIVYCTINTHTELQFTHLAMLFAANPRKENNSLSISVTVSRYVQLVSNEGRVLQHISDVRLVIKHVRQFLSGMFLLFYEPVILMPLTTNSKTEGFIWKCVSCSEAVGDSFPAFF